MEKHSFLLLKRVKSSKTLRSKIFLSIEQLEISWYIKSERNLAGKSEIKKHQALNKPYLIIRPFACSLVACVT